MDWISKTSGRTVKKQTNIWKCIICKIDHILKDTHIDDAGWETIELPIRDLNLYPPSDPSRKASRVKTYIDLSLRNPVKPTTKKPPNNTSYTQSLTNNTILDNTKEKNIGIRLSKSSSKNCGKCDFHIRGRCALHNVKTKSNEVCSRFNRQYIKVYLGGSMSPR